MSNLDFAWAVRGIDRMLRQRQGIEEFTDDPYCVWRIARVRAVARIVLSDGATIAPGDPVIHIHFWNEHLPVMPPEGLTAAWAGQMTHRIRHSFNLLADDIAREPRYRDIVAIAGTPTFPRRIGPRPLTRTLRNFGFDVVPPKHPEASLHARLDSLLIVGLTWAYNPVDLRRHGLSYGRLEIWMSRGKLIERHGTRVPGDANKNTHQPAHLEQA